MSIAEKLTELGIVLPQAPAPVANYVGCVVAGGLVVVSGQLPMRDGALLATGKLGAGVSIEDGKAAARQCFVNLLAQLNAARRPGPGRRWSASAASSPAPRSSPSTPRS